MGKKGQGFARSAFLRKWVGPNFRMWRERECGSNSTTGKRVAGDTLCHGRRQTVPRVEISFLLDFFLLEFYESVWHGAVTFKEQSSPLFRLSEAYGMAPENLIAREDNLWISLNMFLFRTHYRSRSPWWRATCQVEKVVQGKSANSVCNFGKRTGSKGACRGGVFFCKMYMVSCWIPFCPD